MASVGGLKEEGTVHKMRNDGTLLQSPASPQHMSPASPQHMSPASPQHMSPASPQHMSPASPQHMSPVSLQHSQQLQTSEDFKNKITVGFNCHGQDIGDQVRHTVPQHLKGHDNDGASGDEFQTGNGDEKNILENNDSRSKSFKYVSSLDDGCKNNLPDMQDLVSKDLIANGQEALYEGCQSYLEGVDKGDWTDKEVCQDRELRHSQKDKSRFCQTKDAEVVSGSNLDVWYDDKECLFGDSKCDQSLLGQFPGTDVESSSIDVVGYGGGCRMCKSAFNASSKCPISLVCGHMICSPCVLDLTESYTCPDCFTKVKDSWLTEDNTDNQSELEVQEISEIEGTITVPYSTPPLGSMSSTPIRSTGDVSTLPMVSTPRETLALTPTLPPHGSSTLTQPINVAVLKLTTHNQLTECATGAPAPPRESAAGAPVNPRGEGTDTKTQPTGSKSGTPEQPTGRANYNIPPETWDMFKLWILQKVDEYGFDGEAIWNNLNQSEMLMLDRLLYGKDDDAYQSQRKVAPSTRPENSHTHMIDGPGGEEPLVTSRVPLPGSHGQCGAPSPGPQERSVVPSPDPLGHGVAPSTDPLGSGMALSPSRLGRGVAPSPGPKGQGVAPSLGSQGRGVSPCPGPQGRGVAPSPGPLGHVVAPSTGPLGRGVAPSTGPLGRGVAPSPGPPGRGVAPSPGPPGRGVAPSPGPPGRGVAPSPGPPGRGVAPSPGPPGRGVAPSPGPPGRGVAPSPGPPGLGVAPSPGPQGCGVTPSPGQRGSNVALAPEYEQYVDLRAKHKRAMLFLHQNKNTVVRIERAKLVSHLDDLPLALDYLAQHPNALTFLARHKASESLQSRHPQSYYVLIRVSQGDILVQTREGAASVAGPPQDEAGSNETESRVPPLPSAELFKQDEPCEPLPRPRPRRSKKSDSSMPKNSSLVNGVVCVHDGFPVYLHCSNCQLIICNTCHRSQNIHPQSLFRIYPASQPS
nr:uncharacterized protein LOC123757292 [Procambarus clarkii]